MAFLLLLPFFLIRFGLLRVLNPNALNRAAHFAPLQNNEKMAYYCYQISNLVFFVAMFFKKPSNTPRWLFYTGVAVYVAGLLLLVLSMVGFSKPAQSGMNREGVYQFSRNPIYVAYFICFFGCVLLTQSPVLFLVLLVFQLSSHWIILSEERWCKKTFGDEYTQYIKQVRRYF